MYQCLLVTGATPARNNESQEQMRPKKQIYVHANRRENDNQITHVAGSYTLFCLMLLWNAAIFSRFPVKKHCFDGI